MYVKAHPDICIVGIGLAGTALALALLDHGYTGSIMMLEKNASVDENKTWCFWDDGTLRPDLQALICKRWKAWQVGNCTSTVTQQVGTDAYNYCCIKGADYYQYAIARLNKAPNVQMLFQTQASPDLSDVDAARACCDNQQFIANLGFTSAPPSLKLQTDGLFQCFTGAWVKTKKPLFDPEKVQLMTQMQNAPNGLEFIYTLPMTPHYALIELTRFSTKVEELDEMSKATEQVLSQLTDDDAEILQWERGVLPMSVGAVDTYAQPKGPWSPIGMRGGAMRAATGYAFLNIHKYSDYAAKCILNGQRPAVSPINRQYKWLDKIFLRVLRQYPTHTPDIFMRMIRGTKAPQFARFMSEQASFSDIMQVIMAMPKTPFIRALW